MNKTNIDFNAVPTPCYIVDETLLVKNLQILENVMQQTGCKILLAQKAFSMFSLYPLISSYLCGTAASSLFEAKLGREKFGKEVHIFSPAYVENEFNEILSVCDHIIFNSFSQWNKFKQKIKHHNCSNVQCGIRINPEYSEIKTDIYNPCYQYSRLGVTFENFKENELDGIDGIHFHTMCEQNSDVLHRTVQVIEKKFGKYIAKMKWINLGGGQHITSPSYDISTLIECILFFKNKYGVDVYLEPGEAVVLNTGFLVSSIIDIVYNKMNICILDTSAACHMPDVLEMPYRPNIINAADPGSLLYTYRLGGPTCLAGDIIGDYSFNSLLKIGDKLVFRDMAHYSMVKNNTFNGINLPAIASYNKISGIKIIKEFSYDDFKSRLS
jgi:carboxynorspermidine decarboxylase